MPDASIVKAVKAMAELNYTGGHIILPAGVKVFGVDSNIIFKRQFYDDLFEKVMNACAPTGALHTPPTKVGDDLSIIRAYNRWSVTGNPGIGKSAFGWCVLSLHRWRSL